MHHAAKALPSLTRHRQKAVNNTERTIKRGDTIEANLKVKLRYFLKIRPLPSPREEPPMVLANNNSPWPNIKPFVAMNRQPPRSAIGA
jgi:hypothetical protein